MPNIKKEVYSILKNDVILNTYIQGRICPTVANSKTIFPAIIYNCITSKIDHKWLMNELYQVSIWGDIEKENELLPIRDRIIWLFHWVRIWDIKTSVVKGINETYNPETKRKGIHISIHIKTMYVLP